MVNPGRQDVPGHNIAGIGEKVKRFNRKMKGYKAIKQMHSLTPREGELEGVLRLIRAYCSIAT